MASRRTFGARTLFSSLAFGCMIAAGVRAEPPKVVRAVPDLADSGIDPALGLITIEFDTDMSQTGHSLCGGGPQFPPITGKPRWTNARTIEIPVKLEPGKTYAFSVNCLAARNFRSAAGEPAEVHPITFKTRAEGESEPAALDTPAVSATLDALKLALDTRYAHKDLKKIDWNAELDALRAELVPSCTRGQLARRLTGTLAKANDLHITVRVDGMTLGTASRNVRANCDLRSLAKLVKEWKQHNPRVATGMYGGIPYLLVADWTGPKADYEPAFEFMNAHKDATQFIVDVRPNSGGDELMAREIAGCFVKDAAIYSRNKIRTPDAPSGWTDTFDRMVGPSPNRPRIRANVCVLMGRANMSSCESFLCMMRYGAGAYLIGESSYGSSGNPKPCDIGNGITVLLPSWIDMTPDDVLVEGRGIAPDELVEWTPPPEGLTAPDTVLGAAWKHLQPKTE